MKRVYQTKFRSKVMVVNGNCLRACVASLLEINLNEIPNLEDMSNKWFLPFLKCLEEHGYEFHGIGLPNQIDDPEHCTGVDGFVIGFGKSSRSTLDHGHAAIYYYGEMVHDPYPTQEGLKELTGFYKIERKCKNYKDHTFISMFPFIHVVCMYLLERLKKLSFPQ